MSWYVLRYILVLETCWHNLRIKPFFVLYRIVVMILSVLSESVWSIYPYYLGSLHCRWGDRMQSYEYQSPVKYLWTWCHQMEAFSALLALCAGIHASPVDSPHKGQWRGALMFSLICAWTNDWANNRNAGDLRRYRARYDVTVMRIWTK